MKADSHRFPMGRVRAAVIILAAMAPAACGWVEIPANRGVSRGPAETAPRPGPSAAVPGQGTARPDSTVTVASGDSVYALSRRHGVPMQAIIDANGLRPPYTLRIGQRLTLPGGGPVATAGATPAEIISTTMPPGDPAAGQPISPTAAASASRSGVSVATLPPLSGATPLPSDLPPPSGTPLPGLSDGPTSAPPEELVPATAAEQQAALTPATGSGFMWPVNGDVIAEFGPQEKGRQNDGINISAPRGTPVRAVESGVVKYVGNELRGYGNLVLIKHANGWVSAYAHNGALLVQRDDTVSRGQVIARVGDSGGVPTPQLHFELRKDNTAVDPRAYLRQPVS